VPLRKNKIEALRLTISENLRPSASKKDLSVNQQKTLTRKMREGYCNLSGQLKANSGKRKQWFMGKVKSRVVVQIDRRESFAGGGRAMLCPHAKQTRVFALDPSGIFCLIRQK